MNGSMREYFLHFCRYLYCPKKFHHTNCLKIRKLILREKPDLVFLMEANSKLLSHVLSNNKSFVSLENKYKESFAANMASQSKLAFFFTGGNSDCSANEK